MIFVHRFVAVIVIPILVVLGFLFACFRLLLAAVMRIANWELAWPPVETADAGEQRSKPQGEL